MLPSTSFDYHQNRFFILQLVLDNKDKEFLFAAVL